MLEMIGKKAIVNNTCPQYSGWEVEVINVFHYGSSVFLNVKTKDSEQIYLRFTKKELSFFE